MNFNVMPKGKGEGGGGWWGTVNEEQIKICQEKKLELK